jgi:hypothetical protein
VTARFAGIGNPHAIAPVPTVATILDGWLWRRLDLLLAARRIGLAVVRLAST